MTNLKGRYSDQEGYIFNLGLISSDKFTSTTKDLEWYLGETYNNSYQPAIMTETPANFPIPEMATNIPDMGTERPKTDVHMTYPEKKSTDEYICQKMRNKDVYKTDMHNIYNIILGHTKEKLQEKAESDATFQAAKTGRDPIGYLIILKKLCL